jgi:hypothetical protein
VWGVKRRPFLLILARTIEANVLLTFPRSTAKKARRAAGTPGPNSGYAAGMARGAAGGSNVAAAKQVA